MADPIKINYNLDLEYIAESLANSLIVNLIQNFKTQYESLYSCEVLVHDHRNAYECLTSIMTALNISESAYQKVKLHGGPTVIYDTLLRSFVMACSWNPDKHEVYLTCTGSKDIVDYLIGIYETTDKKHKKTLDWFYKNKNGHTDSMSINITQDIVPKDCYYPYITGGIDNFLRAYQESSESVLILYGAPGTGKTSFLRNYLISRNLSALITYDESILSDDGIFVKFITHKHHDVMIIEDADLLIQSREIDNNKMMTKFLNVSNGLVQFNNKKLIFTTNITNINKIDSALIRPGRCFGVIEFKPLSFGEANVLCKEERMPALTEEKDYTLADIFNRGISDTSAQSKFGIL